MVSGLPWPKKIVDDIIIWAPTLEELQEQAMVILDRCRELNITVSLKKLELGKEITFAGHIISQAGIRPDDSKYKAVANFLKPTFISWQRLEYSKSDSIESGTDRHEDGFETWIEWLDFGGCGE